MICSTLSDRWTTDNDSGIAVVAVAVAAIDTIPISWWPMMLMEGIGSTAVRLRV